MDNKPYWKSKTMRCLICGIVIVLLNVLGVGEAEPGQTYDTMLEQEGRQTEQAKNIFMLISLIGAAYGRKVANTKLGKKKEGED